MAEVSIKFRKNAVRGSTSPGDCINLRHPLCPDGADGVKFGTILQGGDGPLTFNIKDRGPESRWPGIKNDAAEIYYGLERVTQHSIYEVQRNDMEGTLDYSCQGHDAHYEKGVALTFIVTDKTVRDWILQVMLGTPAAEGWLGANVMAPFVNSSQKYIDTMETAENPTLHIGWPETAASEQIISDLLKYCDFARGIFPGREAKPNGLGCYVYWQHRTRGKKPKWYITKDDMAQIPGGGFKVKLDWSKYCNRVACWYKDLNGASQVQVAEDAASQAKYTPGSKESYRFDAQAISGYLTAAQAYQAALTYLTINKEPQPKGSIVIPLKKIQKIGGGMQWSGFMRAGDIVQVERDEYRAFDEANPLDNYNAYLVEQTNVDVSAGTQELTTSDVPGSMESLLQTLQAA
ncbi:MAG: hypothetical protein WC911_03520 [Thermoleophilia bacterium]